jgi:preprotein translocase subunit SecE
LQFNQAVATGSKKFKMAKASKKESNQTSAGQAGVAGGVTTIVPRSIQFLREAWYELAKVHFPTRKETYQATAVVLAVVVISATFLGLVDFALSYVMQLFMGTA